MADTMTPDKELTAIQTWIKATAGLNSWKLKAAPSKLGRPVVILDPPGRGASRNVDRYEYVIPVKQYGRLCVNSTEEAILCQGQLLIDLGEKCNVLHVVEDVKVVRRLRNVQIEFFGDDLDSNFTISYEVSYYRTKPADAPNATRVVSTIN